MLFCLGRMRRNSNAHRNGITDNTDDNGNHNNHNNYISSCKRSYSRFYNRIHNGSYIDCDNSSYNHNNNAGSSMCLVVRVGDPCDCDAGGMGRKIQCRVWRLTPGLVRRCK